MKEIIIQIPEYENGVFTFSWVDGAKIKTKIEDNIDIPNSQQIVIVGNKKGLVSLANHLLNLAQDDVPNNEHFHLDKFNSLENGSVELIFEKDNNL